ncbi:MAG: helix-turn-helix domain-containing protein [Sneathiellaceae bacterium]
MNQTPENLQAPDPAGHGAYANIDGVAPSRRLRAWNDALYDTYYPLDVNSTGNGFSCGRLFVDDVGPVRAGWVSSDAMIVHRRRGHLAGEGGDYVLLPMPLDDPLRLHQRGREALVRPGDLAMVATCDTYCYEQRTTNRHRPLRLPGQMLRRRVPHLEDLTAMQFRAGQPSVDLFMDFASSYCRHAARMGPDAAGAATRTLLDLLVMALVEEDADSGRGTAVQVAHGQRALRYIEAHLTDPGLSVGRVAAAVNVSERYLQQIFAGRGQSVSELIRNRRIEAAQRLLREPQARGTTIAVIALRAGFHDPAHFSKLFRAATGMTPKAYRATALTQGGEER